MKFIDNWKRAIWKRWSVRIQIVATGISSLMVIDPGVLLGAWNMLPPAVSDLLPARFVQGLGLVLMLLNCLTIWAVAVKQKNLEESNEPKPE